MEEQKIRSKTLLLLSTGIVVVHLINLKITKINLLGNTAEIGNPVIAVILLWLIWGYFLWKHWQTHVNSKTRILRHYKNEQKKLLHQIGTKELVDLHHEKQKNKKLGGFNFEKSTIQLKLFSAICYPKMVSYSINGEPTESDEFDEVRIGFFELLKVCSYLIYRILIRERDTSEVMFPYFVAIAPIVALALRINGFLPN